MKNFIKHFTALLLLVFYFPNNLYSQVIANDDYFNVVYGSNQFIAGDLLVNDLINGNQAQLSNVSVTLLNSTNPNISISGSSVVVGAGTMPGTYTLQYQLCDLNNPSICDTGTVKLRKQLITQPDYMSGSVCGGNVGNVLGYGTNLTTIDSINGEPAVLVGYYSQPGNSYIAPNVLLNSTSSYPGITIDSAGNVLVDADQVTPGQYTLTYQLCDIDDANNCSQSYVNLYVYARVIITENDDFTGTPISNLTNGSTNLNVLTNDYIECLSGGISIYNSYVYPTTIPNGFSIDQYGIISVTPGIPPGIYLLHYKLCELAPYENCDEAVATVAVYGNSTVVANYDEFSSNYPNSTTSSVLENDTINGQPIVNTSDVIVYDITETPGLTINSNGTISIADFVSEGVYFLPYQICSSFNPDDCFINYAYVVVVKNRINGSVKFDSNSNGCGNDDPFVQGIQVKNENGATTYFNCTSSGTPSSYYLLGNSGTNTVSLQHLPSYFTVTPPSQTFNFTSPSIINAADFCISINSLVDDLEVILVPKFTVVPGLPTYYDIYYKNHGSTTLSGNVILSYDSAKMNFLNSSPMPVNSGNGTLIYSFSTIAPFETKVISNVKFQLEVPPTNNLGDYLNLTATISPNSTDFTPNNNVSNLVQTVVNSQDPNDIIVHEGAIISLQQAQQDYLHYTIRFQNIGTSDAINIKIVNELETKLDWNSFEFVGASHPCRVKSQNGHLEFLFENINLPGVENEALSHGYVTYKVRPISTIAAESLIFNSALIYFDFNDPISTNVALTLIDGSMGLQNTVFSALKFHPNPVKDILNLSNTSLIQAVEVNSILGQQLFKKEFNTNQCQIDVSTIPSGIYLLKVFCEDQVKVIRFVKE